MSEGTSQPTLTELVAAMRAINAPTVVTHQAAPEDRGLAKHASTVIVVIAGALCVWVGTTLTGLSTQVTTLATTMQGLNKSMDDYRSSAGQAAKDVSDLRAQVSRDDQRISTNEGVIGRLNERVRMLEGSPPLRARKFDG